MSLTQPFAQACGEGLEGASKGARCSGGGGGGAGSSVSGEWGRKGAGKGAQSALVAFFACGGGLSGSPMN